MARATLKLPSTAPVIAVPVVPSAPSPRAIRTRSDNIPSPAPPLVDLPRLAKVMSERGLCSRREADEWIEHGWVSVNGKVVTVLGARIAADARIEINPDAAKHLSERVTILLHKAVGIEGMTEKEGRVLSRTVVNAANQWEEDTATTTFQRGHLTRIVYAGSLDANASGLVVFTQDERVARRLVANDAEEEFVVQVEGELSGGAVKRLEQGLMLGRVKLPPARASWQSEGKLRLVLRGSRPGLVESVCVALGLKPIQFRRIRIGSVPLAKLPVGQWRYLQRGERL